MASETSDKGFEIDSVPFDEESFMKREVHLAHATFLSVALGVAAGALSWGLGQWGAPFPFSSLPTLLGLALLPPTLKARGIPKELRGGKSIVGPLSILFFTALSVWVLLLNVGM